jgi:hypothetical protein
MNYDAFIDKEVGEGCCEWGGAADFAKHSTKSAAEMRMVIQVRQRRRHVKRCGLAIIVSSYVTLELGMSMGRLINVMNVFEARHVNSPRGYHMILQTLYGILMLITR